MTRTPLSTSTGQMSTCRGGGILWRPPAQLVITRITCLGLKFEILSAGGGAARRSRGGRYDDKPRRSNGRRAGVDDRHTPAAVGRRRQGRTATQPLSSRLARQHRRPSEGPGR